MDVTASPETSASGIPAPNTPQQPGDGTQPDKSVTSSDTGGPPAKKTGKRERVALACQRCKTRKQKCDGNRPACGSCSRLSLKCVYIIPLVPAAGEKKLYIRALEQRVAELESQLATLGQSNVSDDHLGIGRAPGPFQSIGQRVIRLEHPESDDEANDILVAVRDLSLSASGNYVGASSNITIGRVLSSVVRSSNIHPHSGVGDPSEHDDPTPKSATRLADMVGVPFLSPAVAQRLMQGWFTHINTRYPALLTPRLLRLHVDRDCLTDPYEKSILHLVYAVSGRWLESAGVLGHFFSDQHYEVAFDEMDEILKYRDSRTLDYLILMALYCIRAPRDPGAWTYVGAAMRLCVELGLHRKKRRQAPNVEYEMDKRRFWTTYFLDRDISIALGRPPSISDHDIDAEFPLDIDEANEDDEVVRQAAYRPLNTPRNPPATLTSFIHRLRLKQIESEIQHLVYRVDQAAQLPDHMIQQFLDRLNAWRDAIPFEASTFVHQPGIPYEGMEFYTIHYHRCVRFLLYPQLAHQPVNTQYARLCADACAGIISDYKRLHHVFPVGFSSLSIQSVFLAGLTLIYCAWLAPTSFLNVEKSLTDCQILLYIITERYPSARKYRDIFERIKTSILELIARGEHQPRNPVDLDADMRARVTNLGGSLGMMGGMGAEYSHMMGAMIGQPVGMDVSSFGMDQTPDGTGLPGPPGPPGIMTGDIPTATLGTEFGDMWSNMGGDAPGMGLEHGGGGMF